MVDVVKVRQENRSIPLLPAAPETENLAALTRWAQDLISVLHVDTENDSASLPLTGGTMAGDIDMDGNDITMGAGLLDMEAGVLDNPLDPTAGTHVGDRDFNDARYVDVAGDTMTGALAMGNKTLSGPLDPTAATHVGDRDFNDNRYIRVRAEGKFTTDGSGDPTLGNNTRVTSVVRNTSGTNDFFRITLASAGSSVANMMVFVQVEEDNFPPGNTSNAPILVDWNINSTSVIDIEFFNSSSVSLKIDMTCNFMIIEIG